MEFWIMWCIQYSAYLLELVCGVGNRQNFVGLHAARIEHTE